jgi:Fe-S-cluster containining protein
LQIDNRELKISKEQFKELYNKCLDILAFYSCPEDCNICCSCDIYFSQQDYNQIKKRHPKAIKKIVHHNETVNGIKTNGYTFIEKPCPLLENNRCTIHDVKPKICKMYPFDFKAETFEMVSIDPCPLGKEVMLDYISVHIHAIQMSNNMLREEKELRIIEIVTRFKVSFSEIYENGKKISLMNFPLLSLKSLLFFLQNSPKEDFIRNRKRILKMMEDYENNNETTTFSGL